MKKVAILFELKDWELKEILAEGFSGEIYTLEDFQAHDEALKRLIGCQDVIVITKLYHDEPYDMCPCSNDAYSKEMKYFAYHQRFNKADVVHQCGDCGFQWKRVKRYIDAIPEQLSFLPTMLNEADGFKKLFL